jgi:glutaminyl-tRNA synthetase
MQSMPRCGSNSLEVIGAAKLEPSLAHVAAGDRYQFERLGYFCVDPDSRSGKLVFNRTLALKDTWAKIEKKQPQRAESKAQ